MILMFVQTIKNYYIQRVIELVNKKALKQDIHLCKGQI